MTISQRFDKFVENIRLTSHQVEDGITKHGGVRKCLNWHYYTSTSESANSMLVGSWGKDTRIRPPRDIDILFVLPFSVHRRYESRTGNKQSQLLQEVKEVLEKTYTSTRMRADDQVVVVPFESYAVEVVPAFALQSGEYWICDTSGGGRYETTDPNAEQAAIKDSDANSSGNTCRLIKMLKKWQAHCSVPIKSFWIELLAIEFLAHWPHREKTIVYYDWMVRDFFKYLIEKAGGYVSVPGTYERLWLGSEWKSKVESAHGRAVKAGAYEADDKNPNKNVDAWWEWRNIFGEDIQLN